MSALLHLAVQPSQLPGKLAGQLLKCLREGTLAPRFHYQSTEQNQKWLKLHQSYSPWISDPSCRAAYQLAFKKTASEIGKKAADVIALGCGPATKEAQLLKTL